MRWCYVGCHRAYNGIYWPPGPSNGNRLEPMIQIFLPQFPLSYINLPIFECGQVEWGWSMHAAFKWCIKILDIHWHRTDNGFSRELNHSLVVGVPDSTPNLRLPCDCQLVQLLFPHWYIQQVHICRDGEMASSQSLIYPFSITIQVRREKVPLCPARIKACLVPSNPLNIGGCGIVTPSSHNTAKHKFFPPS